MLAAVLVIAACAHHAKEPAMPSPLAADAVAGISDPGLRAVVAEHWEYMMRWAPTWATTLGDHRFDAQLAPRDVAAVERAQKERDEILGHARAVHVGALNDTDRVTLELLVGRLEADRALDVCKFHEWLVDSSGGSLLGELSYMVESHTVRVEKDAENVIARVLQGEQLVAATIENLKLGLAHGRVSSQQKLARVLEQLDAELAKPTDSWTMANPPWAKAHPARVAELRAAVRDRVAPAMKRFRAFLHDEVLPHARKDNEGLSALPDGDACYRATIVQHVGLAKSPQELHELGLAEIARTDRELAALGQRVLGTPDLASTIAKLRDDKSLYFTSREEILAAAQKALDRAKAAIPGFFSLLPKTDCVMREIPDYEAPFSTVAYYRQPHYDGSKPGEYFVNTYKPETRPRFELEALTWHESIPGHHLQIALSQELGALPAFRKLDGSTAYVEGWALYTERLADEMGLYSADLDRLGKTSYDAWRASRLVVDTGIHALGWTRARAEAFMHEHTALTAINISNEVDRYIGWPGQALAYKIGQIEIFRLRADAEKRLGAKFDLKQFHAVVLGAGAVTLPVLATRVNAWIEANQN
jgi:uncharacterized protein (DUF885 family)